MTRAVLIGKKLWSENPISNPLQYTQERLGYTCIESMKSLKRILGGEQIATLAFFSWDMEKLDVAIASVAVTSHKGLCSTLLFLYNKHFKFIVLFFLIAVLFKTGTDEKHCNR